MPKRKKFYDTEMEEPAKIPVTAMDALSVLLMLQVKTAVGSKGRSCSIHKSTFWDQNPGENKKPRHCAPVQLLPVSNPKDLKPKSIAPHASLSPKEEDLSVLPPTFVL